MSLNLRCLVGLVALLGALPSAHAQVTGPAAVLCGQDDLRLVPGGRTAVSTEGMVVSVDPLATRAGTRILEEGGNAVDAAIAVATVLAVTHPSAGNLGGGGFALVHVPGGGDLALDFREVAPSGLERGRFLAMIENERGEGRDSVGIPGTVAGLTALHDRFATLPLEVLLLPAITLAEQGHRVSTREAAAIARAWPRLRHDPEGRLIFGSGKKPHRAEHWLRRPKLAGTLRRIASQGRDGFYRGPTAASILSALGPNPMMTMQDLEAARAVERRPRELCYGKARVLVMPSPSAGGVAVTEALTMLGTLTRPIGEVPPLLRAHLLAEILGRAHIDRVYDVVDPDSLTLAEREEAERRYRDPSRWFTDHPIRENRATPPEELLHTVKTIAEESPETTHLAVVDRTGMAVSLTTTLSSGFGAKLVTDTDVVLNNTVASFSGLGRNQPKGGRRTTSSMSPLLVFDRSGLRLVLGTPGGDTIPSTLVQLLVNLLDRGLPLDQAVDEPRLHPGIGRGACLRTEPSRPLAGALVHGLRALGHCVTTHRYGAMGHANSVLLSGERFYGYADPREGGAAAGPKQDR